MTLDELIHQMDCVYPDGKVAQVYAHYKLHHGSVKGLVGKEGLVGDGLAVALVVEIVETFDAKASDQDKLKRAQECVSVMVAELQGVEMHLEVLQKGIRKVTMETPSPSGNTGDSGPE